MKFGAVAPKDARGATAVHTIRQGDLVLKKGTLIGPAEIAALEAKLDKARQLRLGMMQELLTGRIRLV